MVNNLSMQYPRIESNMPCYRKRKSRMTLFMILRFPACCKLPFVFLRRFGTVVTSRAHCAGYPALASLPHRTQAPGEALMLLEGLVERAERWA